MKKILGLSLILLLFAGVSFATNIPKVTAPESTSEVWLAEVYLNSSTAADDGDVLIWDIDASTGDEFMYVIQTTTANTGPIAGVAYGDISANSVGRIVIWGQYDVDLSGANGAAGGIGNPIITSTTSGAGNPVTTGGSIYHVGYLLESTTKTSTTASAFIDPGLGSLSN